MGIFKYFRFSKNENESSREQSQQQKNVNSTGWAPYNLLPCKEPWPPQRPQDWVMERGIGSKKLDYQGVTLPGTELVWHNRATGEIRMPQENSFTLDFPSSFVAAGKSYGRMQDLVTARWQDDPSMCWTLDCYGRKTFSVFERFSCFDSYDYLYEDRYYRWIYIYENGMLTRIYTADSYKNQKIYITEDVAFLENKAWEEMEKAGYLEKR